MIKNPDAPARKMVNLPRDIADWFERWRVISFPESSESEALRRLIEIGLKASENPDQLRFRCQAATEAGATIGQIYANILEGHPLIMKVTITDGGLRGDFKADQDRYLIYSPVTRDWVISDIPF